MKPRIHKATTIKIVKNPSVPHLFDTVASSEIKQCALIDKRTGNVTIYKGVTFTEEDLRLILKQIELNYSQRNQTIS